MRSRLLRLRFCFILGFLAFSFLDCSNNDVVTPTSGGESGLLEGAFDSVATYPAPVSFTYTGKDGTTVNEDVFPGQIVVLLSPSTSSGTAANLFSRNGGKIVAQTPKAGLYVVSIDPNTTSPFLSAMYQSPLVIDAFPNGSVIGRSLVRGIVSSLSSSRSAPPGLVQTIDDNGSLCATVTHEDAVATISGQNGVSVQVNDVSKSIPQVADVETVAHVVIAKLLELIANAKKNNAPLVVNISLGSPADNLNSDKHFYTVVAAVLQAASQQFPGILDNVVVFVAGSDKRQNETDSFLGVKGSFPENSSIWKSLYFVESQEGAAGCGMGYATTGAPNVIAAPACHISIPNTECPPVSGTSFAAPAVANLVAQAYVAGNGQVSLITLADKLWKLEREIGIERS